MLKLSSPISEDELKAEIVRDLEDEEALNTPKRKRQRLKRIPEYRYLNLFGVKC